MGKILNIGQIVSFGVGGADKSALNLVKGLLKLNENIKVTVFYNKFSFPRNYELTTNPSRFSEYKSLPLDLIKITNVNELNNYNIDILNTHRSGNDNWFLPNFEATNFNFKIVETNFHGYNKTKSDYRVYPSKEIIKYLQPTKIPYSIIPNPIIRPLTTLNLREELKINNKFVYGRIGRVDDEIYSNISLQAYKKIESTDTCFLYVGKNEKAVSDAKKLEIKNIIFLNPTSDEIKVSKIYNTFDVLCHSTPLGETFGNTIAEAMINGKPVVSHIGNGTWPQAQKELLGEKKELFITHDIINSYTNLMLKLKNNKKFYNLISTYLKHRALDYYDYIKVSKKYLELYLELL